MRALLAAALLLAAPTALADDACEPEATRVEPVAGAPLYASIERRGCGEARSWDVALQDPDGRTDVQWYEDERGVGLALFRPPRVLAWYADEGGCAMVAYAFGAIELACLVGAPPPPPQVPR